MIRTALRIAFWLALVVWYVLLVRPTPQDITNDLKGLSDLLPFIVAKTLHLTAYAVFAGWGLAVFDRWRWWAFGVVAAHAILGEVGQYVGNEWFATGRTGTVKDVLIDWGGMLLGCGAWWAGCRILRPHPPAPSPSRRGGVQGPSVAG